MKKSNKIKVLIAGIGGASLGTEILKSLLITKKYRIFGCDISKFAYGIYQKEFEKTFVVNSDNYLNSILDICHNEGIDFIIPGGEETNILIGNYSTILENEGVKLAINHPELINKFSDKNVCFETLSNLGINIPLTKCIVDMYDINNELCNMTFPCIIKPSKHSGGSNFTFLANNKDDAKLYISYMLNNEKIPLLQEYIPVNEGEFTIGVLSFPNKQIACSIALKRLFNSKLSISSRTNEGIISSGYTQGFIDYFPEICKFAENIATSIGSQGPLNIQGRIKNGIFIPFEINVRFSASTYLRAMAGINEVDIFLDYLSNEKSNVPRSIKTGYYLRSFTESFVDKLKW